MFLVGTEIDFNRIEKEGFGGIALAGVVATATLGVAVLLAWKLEFPLYLALVLGAMSVGILLVTLNEVGESGSRYGQALLLIGSIGELLTLLALTGYDLIHRHGIGTELVVQIGKALFLFVVALSILALLRLAVWWFPHRFKRWVDMEDPSEIGVRAGITLMLSLAALAGWVGLESILGAFLAGALFSYVFRDKGVLETKLSALGQGFFIPIFFINVGVEFDMTALGEPASLLKLVAILAVASLVTKLIPAALLMISGISFRQVFASAFILAAPLTLLVAASEMGRELGVLDDRLGEGIVLLAIVSGIVFPTAFKILVPKHVDKPPRTADTIEGLVEPSNDESIPGLFG
jgi:Kef-type K+ transport system membrane component KefB